MPVRTILRFAALLTIFISNLPAIKAQENIPVALNFHRWGSITVFNGLPSDSVRAISQTPDGVLWFGTDNGLARFDGRRVQNFTLGEGDANRVLTLRTDPTGRLWIGTQQGAFVYSANRFQSVTGTEDVAIQSMLLGDEDLLGTNNGQILRVVENKAAFSAESIAAGVLSGLDGKPLVITGLVKGSDGLLAGTYGRGIFVFRDGRFHETPSLPQSAFINSLSTDSSGKVWVGSDAKKGVSGIFSISSGSRADRIAAPTASVWPLATDSGGVWVGTARYGLFHIRGSRVDETFTFENTSGGLRSDTILSIFTDREGVVWIGTNRGLSRYDPVGPFQQAVSDIPNSNFIRTLFSFGADSIFAGSNRGLFVSNAEGWKPIPGFDGKVIYAIAGHNNSGPLIGTASGLVDIHGKPIFNGDVRGFADFGSRTYAAVYGRGVMIVPPATKAAETPDAGSAAATMIFQNESVTSIAAGRDRLWIGTAGNGLFSFNGKSVNAEVAPSNLQSGTIWKMFAGNDGTLWIAGQHGVFTYRDGSVEQIIKSEDVRDVFVDGQNVWAATTSQGLLHARKDERFGWLVSPIGFEQGLPSEKAFAILPMDGWLLIATNRGVVRFYPQSFVPKLIPIRVLSQRLHDLAELSSTISLEYPQNSLLVEVAGQSSRTFPEEFQYSFQLTNAKGEVVDSRLSNDPQYTPTDLKPGEYSIESVAFNRDLLSSDPLTIRFSVAKAPFPWTATALGVLLLLSLVGLVWAVVEHRRIRERNRELAAARLDLANEAERERRRIARDLHDQTLADLRNLMMMSDKFAPEHPEFRNEVEGVSSEIRRICEDLSPSVLENVGFIASLEFLLTRTIENHRFDADEGLEDHIVFPINVQLQIYRIAQEVLANIKRHSTADTAEMSISVNKAGEFLLIIRDNGPAFQPTKSNGNGRGIANIRARAQLIGADIEWKKRRRGGNRFSLRLSSDRSFAS